MTQSFAIQDYIKIRMNNIIYHTIHRITAFYEGTQDFNGTVFSFIEPNKSLTLQQIIDFPSINFEENTSFSIIDSEIYCQSEQIDKLKSFFPMLMKYMCEDDFQ